MAETDAMNNQSAEWRFVAYLRSLTRSEARGALAKLRRSVGKDTPDAEALRLIAPYLPADKHRTWRCQCYELVAGLFALHPESDGSANFGASFRHPRMGDNESAQKRFVALLDSDVADLPHRLRQAVRLAKSKEVPINWAQLLKDLLSWDHEDRFVQYSWARAYWGSRGIEESQEPAAAAGSEKEGD